jgi:hypothetical protein
MLRNRATNARDDIFVTFKLKVKDGIESVQLVLMKVKDLARDGRVQIEVPAKSNMALHEYALEHFGEQNPLSSGGFSPVQAKINIRFHPENGHGRGKVLPVSLAKSLTFIRTN